MKRNIISIIMIATAIMLLSASVCFATLDIPTATSTDALNGIGGKIIGLVQAVGTIVAVVMLIVVGIKYLTSSPEGKAQYKGTMIAYVVGAILIFAASNLVKLIYNWTSNNVNE